MCPWQDFFYNWLFPNYYCSHDFMNDVGDAMNFDDFNLMVKNCLKEGVNILDVLDSPDGFSLRDHLNIMLPLLVQVYIKHSLVVFMNLKLVS